MPAFTYPSSGCGLYTCANGTATGSDYGITANTQSSQQGFLANTWKDDWRDLAIAATTAYCTRYEPGGAHASSAFYTLSILYYNTSLALAPPYPAGFDYDTFLTKTRDYLTAARAACPTTNIGSIVDFVNSHPTQTITMLNHLRTMHGTLAQNDVIVAYMSNGQSVHSGEGGTDYRGVTRYIEEVESPDMCGYYWGNHGPAELFGIMQNGNAGNRPRWPTHIAVWMASECDSAGTGWAAWKAFIASINGYVMNGRNSTLRSPGEVKQSYCETSMTCP